jgi:hypothetical protein
MKTRETGIPKVDGLEGSEVRFFALSEVLNGKSSMTQDALRALQNTSSSKLKTRDQDFIISRLSRIRV